MTLADSQKRLAVPDRWHQSMVCLFVLLILLPLGWEARAATQTFVLAAQWNLISFQVTPSNPDPAAVFGTLPGFQAAWTYDANARLWRRYVKPAGTTAQQNNDALANQILPMGLIEPGRAYWVYLSQAVPTWQVNGTVPQGTAFPSLNLRPGWNLFGVPVGSASVTHSEPVSLLAVLTAAGFDYDALFTWENQTFRKMFRPRSDTDPLAGLPPELPFPAFDLQKDLGRGYWIHVLDPAVLRPRALITVRPDVDAEPLNNFPAKEDVNVSGARPPAQPKSVQQQDAIRFFPGEDVQVVSISNLGDGLSSGGGILLWEATWAPVTDSNTPEPWIRLFTAPQERERRDSNGQLVAPYSILSGVTTLENDMVYLRLDRKNLGRGIHEGLLHVRTSVGDRSYRVLAEVPGLEGDYRGHAVIQSVNGRRNPVPDVDLVVGFFEDIKVEGLLRGVIDSSQALLWPADVPLVGYRVSNEANRFVLGGSFVLPPGDQNGEPFDQWNESDPAAGMDIDWLNDGRLDAQNPFPFPIQRTVTLEGELLSANPSDGYVLGGQYTEIIHGMSREPLVLSGSFRLERIAIRPLSSRRNLDRDTGIEPVVFKKNPVPHSVPPGAVRVSTLTVNTELELRHFQVELVFNSPLAHSALLVKLQSPGRPGTEIVLYDGTSVAGAINPKLLEKIIFPLERPTHGDAQQFLRAIQHTRTTNDQFWSLSVANAGVQPVTLASWTLRLDGQPVTDVFGIVRNGTDPVPGVSVALDGLPVSAYSGSSGADGTFNLSRVPLLPLNFSAARPGYRPANDAWPGLAEFFTKPFLGQAGLTFTPLEDQWIRRFNRMAGAPPAIVGVPGFTAGTVSSPYELQIRPVSTARTFLAAGPRAGYAGSTIEFHALNPAGTVRWNFGDGTSGSLVAETHVYDTAGVYRAQLFSPAESVVAVDSIEVEVWPAPSKVPRRPVDLRGLPHGLPVATSEASYVAYLFQPSFTSAGVLPARKTGTEPATGADRYVSDLTPRSSFAAGETNAFGAAYVAVMPLQHAYAASMDLDLAPKLAPTRSSRPFAEDGFIPLAAAGTDPSINNNDQGFRLEDFNYAHLATLWQNTRTEDGSTEYIQDPQNGLIVWGNVSVTPHPNYSVQTSQAADGADFTFALQDDTFHPYRRTTPLAEMATHAVASHFTMACSMGGTIVNAPVPTVSVKSANARRSQPANPVEPELISGSEPRSRNLYYVLRTGAFARRSIRP